MSDRIKRLEALLPFSYEFDAPERQFLRGVDESCGPEVLYPDEEAFREIYRNAVRGDQEAKDLLKGALMPNIMEIAIKHSEEGFPMDIMETALHTMGDSVDMYFQDPGSGDPDEFKAYAIYRVEKDIRILNSRVDRRSVSKERAEGLRRAMRKLRAIKEGEVEDDDVFAMVLDTLYECGYAAPDITGTNESETWFEFGLEHTPFNTLFINCHTLTRHVWIHNVIPIAPYILEERQERLLEACNIFNREAYMKARISENTLDIVYEIPEGAGDALGEIIKNVLHSFHFNIDYNLLAKAVYTDEELNWRYYSNSGKQS